MPTPKVVDVLQLSQRLALQREQVVDRIENICDLADERGVLIVHSWPEHISEKSIEDAFEFMDGTLGLEPDQPHKKKKKKKGHKHG